MNLAVIQSLTSPQKKYTYIQLVQPCRKRQQHRLDCESFGAGPSAGACSMYSPKVLVIVLRVQVVYICHMCRVLTLKKREDTVTITTILLFLQSRVSGYRSHGRDTANSEPGCSPVLYRRTLEPLLMQMSARSDPVSSPAYGAAEGTTRESVLPCSYISMHNDNNYKYTKLKPVLNTMSDA